MQFFQAPLTAVLCLSLVGQSLSAVAQAGSPDSADRNRPAYRSAQLQGDERILHALNRFTFGPRPGDLQEIRTMGLDKWIEQQLHPASIDETDLRARLAQFPAMEWTPAQLLYRAPSNAIIRQTIAGKLPLPEHGALRAVYENQIFRFSEKKQAKDQKKNLPAGLDPNTAEASQMRVDLSSAPEVDEQQFARILSLAPDQRVSALAAMPPEAADNFFKSLRPQQRASLVRDLTPDLKEVVLDLEGPQRLVNQEIIAQRLTRDIYSSAQLQEVMTDFWMNHFTVFLHKNDEMPYYLVSYERDVIRPRALGKFEDLLEATAHSPAMLLYLDNASSIGPDSLAAERAQLRPNEKKRNEGLNENYARELMELHTVGVNGGYTQADVTQVARILTGWTVDRPQRGGEFQFDPRRHEPGAKTVMGKKFKEHGEQEGRDLLHMLASRPTTAQFISRKLAIRFVSDDPPQALIDRMARTFLSSDGDIKAVLTSLFHSPEFWEAGAYRAKVKTPIEFLVSAARASNAQIENLQPLANAAREMGMPLYGCVTPNGYSWTADTWVSTNALVTRMNFALSFAANRLPGIANTWTPAQRAETSSPNVNPTAADPTSEERRLENLLVEGGVSETTRAAVLQQFEQQKNRLSFAAQPETLASAERPRFRLRAVSDSERQDQLLAGLLLGSPEFQRR
jgi:uncharacterized protein (DUF1800 family)